MSEIIRVILRVDEPGRDALETALIMAGATAMEERDESISTELKGFVEFHLYGAGDDEKELRALVARANVESLLAGPVRFLREQELDWAEAWKVHYRPLRLSPRVTVVPSWIEYQAEPDERVIVLDPGAAFGTGQHATTALCIRALDLRSAEGAIGAMADIGTGTGILSLAGQRLGATELWLTENDPEALAIARENLAGLAADFELCERPISQRHFDTVVANILAEPLLAMAGDLVGLLAPGASLIVSGLLCEQAEALEARFLASGLRRHRRWDQDEWSLLWLQQAKGAAS